MDQSIKSTKAHKQKMVKVEIQLNEQVKIGLIGYKVSDPIYKIYNDMKKIKIIGDEVEPHQVKYFNKDGVALDQRKEFSKYFDPKVEVNVVKIFIPVQYYDYDRATKKAEEYLKSNQVKKPPKEQSQILVKNLKKSLIYIKDQKYENIQSNIQNQQLSQIIGLYSQQHKKILAENNIYNHLIEQILFDKDLLKENFNLSQISQQSSTKINQIIDKYNQLKHYLQQHDKNSQQSKQQSKQKSNFDIERKAIQQNYSKKLQQQQNKYLQMQQHFSQKIKKVQQDADNYYKDKIYRMQQQILQLKNLFSKVDSQRQDILNQLQREKMASNIQYQRTEIFSKYFDHFVDHQLILNSFFSSNELTNNFLQYFQSYCQKSPKNFNILYRSKYQAITDRFIECLSQKSNIFLIAKTKQGKIFGGYTQSILKKSKSNKLRSEKVGNQKSFLFSFCRNKINFFPLKAQSSNLQCDNLFISFGAEEISIDRFQLKVESIFVTGDQNEFNYSDIEKNRKLFLSDSEDWSSELEGFEIYSVNIA